MSGRAGGRAADAPVPVDEAALEPLPVASLKPCRQSRDGGGAHRGGGVGLEKMQRVEGVRAFGTRHLPGRRGAHVERRIRGGDGGVLRRTECSERPDRLGTHAVRWVV